MQRFSQGPGASSADDEQSGVTLRRPSDVTPLRAWLDRNLARRRVMSRAVTTDEPLPSGAKDLPDHRSNARGVRVHRVSRRWVAVGSFTVVVVAVAFSVVSGEFGGFGPRASGEGEQTGSPSLPMTGAAISGTLPESNQLASTSATTTTIAFGVLPIVTVAPPSTTTATIAVHAAGAVAQPGVYVFAEGARVDDVIAAAGGLTADADADVLNRAALVVDATRVFVPRRGQTVPSIVAAESTSAAGSPSENNAKVGTSGSSSTSGPVNLNTATVEQLDALPGVGPATAAAILEYRRTHQRFRSVGELLQVPGIGQAKFEALRTKVRV